MAVHVDTERKASDRQIAFLRELAQERAIDDEARARLIGLLDRHEDASDAYRMPFAQADRAIKWFLDPNGPPVRDGVVPSHIRAMPKGDSASSLLGPVTGYSHSELRVTDGRTGVTTTVHESRPIRKPQRRDPSTLPTSGVFRKDGETYVIVPSRRNPGRHYAMRMIKTPNRLTSSGEVVNFDYVKDPGAIWQLYEEHRLPEEAVEALVVQHKVCIYPGCDRVLRAAKSVSAGVGKRHAEKLGIPWGKK